MHIGQLMAKHGINEGVTGIKQLSQIVDVYVTHISNGGTYYTLEFPLSEDGVYVKIDYAFKDGVLLVENIILREEFITERFKVARGE